MLAFADIRYNSEILFLLPLRLVDWFIGSFEDGINDVNHGSGGRITYSFWYLSWLELRWRRQVC